MKSKSFIFKPLLLIVSLFLSLTSCSGASESSSGASNTSSFDNNTASSYNHDYSGVESSFESQETNEYVTNQITRRKIAIDESDIYMLMVDSIYCSLEEMGYKAFAGYAIVDIENSIMVPGIGYTTYEIYCEDEEIADGEPFYSCGFYQLVLDEEEISITEEMVVAGVPVVPEEDKVLDGRYIISVQANVEPFSGIYLEKYFSYQMVNDYIISAKIQNNSRSVWDESIDLYDFDNRKYIFKTDLEFISPTTIGYYQDEYANYCAARDAYEKIIQVQDEYGFEANNSVLIIFSKDTIANYLLTNQIETLNQIVMEQLRDVVLEEHQFIMITQDGVSIRETQEYLANQRLTNGIIASISGALAIAGSVIACVATWGAAAPIAIKVIVSVAAGVSSLYFTSNLVEAGLDVYYGATGDGESHATNPLLDAFKLMFGDTAVTTTIYHAFGIANSLIASLGACFSSVVSTAAQVAAAAGKSIGLAVTRAVLVTIGKMVVTAGLAIVTNNGVTILVEKVTGNPFIAKIAGAVSGIIAAIIVAKGLQKLDEKIGLSYNRNDLFNYQRSRSISKITDDFKNSDVNNESNARKGNFGELESENEMLKNGWTKKSVYDIKSLDDSGHHGIDGIYEKDGKYVILESKFGSSQLGNTADGKEMCKDWVMNRLEDALGGKTPVYYDILAKWTTGDVVLAISRINATDFSILYALLDDEANIVRSNIESILELFINL